MMAKRLPIEDQTMLVTGSTDGIGRQTALELARRGANVLVHGRSEAKAEKVAAEIRASSGNAAVDWVVGDLSSLREVRVLANTIQSRCERLDVLINNAGTVSHERRLTPDGLELTFAVNYVAPFLLTQLLLDLMRREEETRIIFVSSDAHHAAYIDFDNLQGERNYDCYEAYDMSKLADLLFAYELARRLQGTHIVVNSYHPGVIDTKLLRKGYGAGGDSVESGAWTAVYLATSDDVAGISGKYFVDCRPVSSSRLSHDRDLAKRLWETTLHLLDLKEGRIQGPGSRLEEGRP